jgi:transposase
MSKIVKLNPLAENIILDVVELLYPVKKTKRGRPTKCTNKDYLNYMFYVLKHGIGWEYLTDAIVKGNTVQRKFNEWSKKGIFKLAWLIIINIYSTFKVDFSDLYIDASHIKNSLGVDYVGSNIYDRFRKATKLSIVCDNLGIPVGLHIDKSNKHDITLLMQTMDNIPFDISSFEFLIGDKGYIGSKQSKEIYKKYCVKLITPNRKNAKIKDNNYDKLKNRYIVERTFSWFKKYRRLCRRKDKLKINFESFVFFGAANITTNKINKIVNR